MKKTSEIRKEWLLERIEEIKHSAGLSYTDIANQLGVKPQYLNNIMRGDRGAGEKFVAKFCDRFNINQDDLYSRFKQNNTENLVSSHNKKKIPLYDVVSVGGVQRVADLSPVTTHSELIDAGDWFPSATAAVRHYGDSMIEYPSGSILVLREVFDRRLLVWGRNYCIETTEYRVTKQLQDGDEEHLIGYSTNKETYPGGKLIHSPIYIPKNTIRRIFLVVGCVTKEDSNDVIQIVR